MAYASLSDSAKVDTVLAYPSPAGEDGVLSSIARVTSGRREVRLILAGLPFGFRGISEQEAVLSAWRKLLTD